MSISGISANTNTYQANRPSSDFQQRRKDFQQLEQALQSGDLSGAQNAFSALQQLRQGAQSGSQSQSGQSGSGAQNQFSTDLTALGKALQSGDLTSAQDAFKKLQQDMQAAHPGHHHHHSAGAQNAAAPQTGSNASGATASTATAGNTVSTSA